MKCGLSRLGIFVFFDPQGIVDEYVTCLLGALRPHFERLVTVSNIELDEPNKAVLRDCCDALFIRENKGLDAAAFKAGLISFCGWEEVERYDEVVLLNDTFFGPVHSFDEMFTEMEQRDVDFWGMSAGYPTPNPENEGKVKYGYVPDHIQSFFVGFRQKMVKSQAFHDYWQNYDDTLNGYLTVVAAHELVMTKHFQDLGYRWDVYTNSGRYRSEIRSENFNLYLNHAYRMMKDMKFPVFKKKVLSLNIPEYLYMNDLEEPAMAVEYIQNCTDYDSDLIWRNVIRIYNPADLYNSLHLNYILPSCPVEAPNSEKIALVYHITNAFFVERFCAHAQQSAEWLDVYILPEGEKLASCVREKLTQNSRITVLKSTRQDTEMGGFVLGCKELAMQYTYLGFVHDVQNPDHYPTTICESTVFGYLQNIANDKDYIAQVIHCFESNPRLGVLGTPFPIHHHGFGNYGNEWGDWYAATKKLSDELKLCCKVDEKKPPVMINGTFWCRTYVLKPLWNKNWKSMDFCRDSLTLTSRNNEALKRILPFVAQSVGYYSGIVMHSSYASMRITGQQYMLSDLVELIREKNGCYSEHYYGFRKQLVLAEKRTSPRLRSKVRIWMERYAPKWVRNAVMGVYRKLKQSKN